MVYLAIDSTFLTGKFRGQLACAIAVDEHNWMYPIAVRVIDSETNDSETNENWIWFMQRLRDANESPAGLAICTDAGQGVKEVFLDTEHRECILHLVSNFKKRYNGKNLRTIFGMHHIHATQGGTKEEEENN